MLTLEKTIKVIQMNRKGTGNYRSIKEGDLITIKFDCDGHGGNSPKVDLYVNGSYVATPFARSVNASLFHESGSWVKGNYVVKPKLIEIYEEEN